MLSTQLQNAHVLIIDDFQGMRTMLRNIVREMGIPKVDTAANGKDALEQLRMNNYEIVICDYNLGGGQNGQQVLEEARLGNLMGVSTIWIMVTAEKSPDMVMGAAEVKPDDYLLKPINQDILENRLEKLAARKQSLRVIEEAIKARNYLGAIEQCDARIKDKPLNLQELLRIKSDLLLTVGNYEEAGGLFDAVLAVRSVPWAKTGLGKIQYQLKNYEVAKKIFKEVLAENRMYMEALDWLVKTLDAMGDAEQAQQVLLNAIKLSPNSTARQKALGEAAYKNGELDIAQAAFEKTLKLSEFSPRKSPSVFAGLAKVFSAKNAPDDAIKVLAQCKKEFKDNPEAALETAVTESLVYKNMGQTEKAIAAMAAASEIREQLGGKMSASVAMEMARAKFMLGQTEEASALLRDVVKNNHENAEVSRQVQALFESEQLGDVGRALIQESRQEVIDINNQGVTLGKEGKLGEAIVLLKKALKELPNNETIMMNLCGLLIVQLTRVGRSDQLLGEIKDLLDTVYEQNPANKKQHELSVALTKVRVNVI